MGLLFATGNSAGIISSNVYPAGTAPRFFEGHGVAVGFSFMAIVCAIIITIANRLENARRDSLYGLVAANGSDASPNKVLTPEQRKTWGLEGLSKTEIIELGDKHPGTFLIQSPLVPLDLSLLKPLTFYFVHLGYRYVI
jgi:hypothetical protein